MARVPVTYEQVAAVANALYAQGVKNPGVKAVRAELAKRAGPGDTVGSPNTIQRHLNEWRLKGRPVDVADVPQLPPQLAGDIQRALTAAAAEARDRVEERLSQVLAELEELAAAGEVLDARVEELQQEVAARTSERDSMAGQLADRTAELDEVKAALTAANEKATELERALHGAHAEAQASNGRVDEIRQSTERQLAQLKADLEAEREARAAAVERASETDRRVVAAEVRLEREQAAAEELRSQLAYWKDIGSRAGELTARAGAAEGVAATLREELQLQKDLIELLRSLLQAAGKEVPPAVAPPPSPKSK